MPAASARPRETAQSEALYGKVAARYDTVFERAILAEGHLTEVLRAALSGRSVLDLGCGNGRWLDRFEPSSYVGIDLNRLMLAEARKRYPAARFLQADMTRSTIVVTFPPCAGSASSFWPCARSRRDARGESEASGGARPRHLVFNLIARRRFPPDAT